MVRAQRPRDHLSPGGEPGQFNDPHTPIENQVRLASPVPLAEPWLRHLAGLAKSDGAVIFNDRLEACQFRARLKPANICLLPDQDDLGGGMRHQVTREFSAYAPDRPGRLRLPGQLYLPLPLRQADKPAVLRREIQSREGGQPAKSVCPKFFPHIPFP